MSQASRRFFPRRGSGRRIPALVGAAAAGGLLVGLGASVLSAGVAASPGPPPPTSVTMSLPGTCALERVGTQFVRCDNLTGAGAPAPTYIPGVQRMGLGDHR